MKQREGKEETQRGKLRDQSPIMKSEPPPLASKIRILMSGSLTDHSMNSLFNISTDVVNPPAMVWLGQSLTAY